MTGYLFLINPHMDTDALRYISPVYNLLHGKGYTIDGEVALWPPGFGLLANIINIFVQNFMISLAIVTIAGYLLSIIAAYCLGNDLSGRRAAFLSAFFIAFCPLFVFYANQPITETVYIGLSLWTCVVFLRILLQQSTIQRSILLGVLLGFNFWIRDEGFILAAGCLTLWGLFIMVHALKKQGTQRIRAKQFGYFGMSAIITMAFILVPVLHLHHHTGSWIISGKMYRSLSKTDISMEKNVIQGQISQTNQQSPASQQAQPQVKRKVLLKDAFLYWEKKVRQAGQYAPQTLRYIYAIIFHALFPLFWISVVWGLWYVRKVLFFRYNQKSSPNIKTLQRIDWLIVLCVFGIFASPLIPLTIWGFIKPRYVFQHTWPFLILCALIIQSLLKMFPSKAARILLLILCVCSLLTAWGVFHDTPFFKSRVWSQNFSIPKRATAVFRKKGIPENLLEQLESLRYRKFSKKDELIQAVETTIGPEATNTYQHIIVKQAHRPMPALTYQMADLQGVMSIRYNQKETLQKAGYFIRNYTNRELDTIKVIDAVNHAYIILFYATGEERIPDGTPVQIGGKIGVEPSDLPLVYFANRMKTEQIDFFVLTESSAKRHAQDVQQLYETPEISQRYDLKLLYRDPHNYFQIYQHVDNSLVQRS